MSTPAEAEAERARLLALLTRLSYEKRKVTLASGRESDFYVDCKKTVLTAEGHYLVGRLLLQAIREQAPGAAAAGGLTLGADPLASAVSLTSYLQGTPLPAFIVRKEPKGHGTGQWMEGRTLIPDGAQVAVLEDVVTTGGSTLKAIERIEAEGLKVSRAFALVDRLEGGREAVEAKGYALTALFTREDFPA
jgi:orotate phosphoribosyltransferase